MLCRAMAVDHAPDGIRINCVCPGSIETPLLEQYRQSGGMPIAEAIEQDRLAHPMQRIGAARRGGTGCAVPLVR